MIGLTLSNLPPALQWGGVRNKATGESWEEGKMVIVFSGTKGLSGLAMALAH